jgi:hypothetical protein
MNHGEDSSHGSLGAIDAVELDAGKFTLEKQGSDCVFATSEGEFKDIEEKDSRKVVMIESRLKSLVSLLQITRKSVNYRVLDCRGYFKTDCQTSKQYACVFSLPGNLGSAPDSRIDRLQSLLRQKEDNTVPVQYPLGAPLRLAALLASSLANLHAEKWLHYNITSYNVICVSSGEKPAIHRPYLLGFGFARVDDPRESVGDHQPHRR